MSHFQSQPYLGHTYQVPIQPQPSMIHYGYHHGMKIPTTQAIPGHPCHPPLGVGLNPQGYQTLQQDPVTIYWNPTFTKFILANE